MTTLMTNADASSANAVAPSKAERMIRRVAFFKRLGLFSDQTSTFTVTRALTLEDHWQAYSLVHECYLQRGYIEPCQGGARVRPFEAMPELATFVAKVGDRVVAVTSVLMDSPELGLPSDKVFAQEVGTLRQEDRRVCEITNLAVHPDYRNTGVFSELTRCCLAHAIAVGYDDMFIAISPEHARFFQEVLLFEPWGDKRSYSEEIEDIVVGMRLDLRTVEARTVTTDEILGPEAFLHDFYFERNTFHGFVSRWAVRAAAIFRDIDLLHELFVVRSGLFSRLTFGEAAAIQSRWGAKTFRQIASEPPESRLAAPPRTVRTGRPAA